MRGLGDRSSGRSTRSARERAANLWYLALAVVVHYTNFLFRGLRWRLLLRNAQGLDAPAPGVIYCAELILLGWFVNSVAWLRLGDFYRAYLYRDEGQASFPLVMGTIVSERLLGTTLVVLLLLVSVPFLVSGGGDPMRSGCWHEYRRLEHHLPVESNSPWVWPRG